MFLQRTHQLIIALAWLLPAVSQAQPMVVLGGGQKAQECFLNAQLVAQNLPGIGTDMLEPCTYTLEYSKLNLKDRAATLVNRGIVYAGMNKFDAAMADYENAMAIDSTAPEFYVNRGNSFFMMRDYASALQDYESSIELGIKQLHLVHYNRGMVFERLGNDATAEQAYLMALEIAPDWDMPHDKLVRLRQRMAEDEAGSSEQE